MYHQNYTFAVSCPGESLWLRHGIAPAEITITHVDWQSAVDSVLGMYRLLAKLKNLNVEELSIVYVNNIKSTILKDRSLSERAQLMKHWRKLSWTAYNSPIAHRIAD
jgi:hypothetical protein